MTPGRMAQWPLQKRRCQVLFPCTSLHELIELNSDNLSFSTTETYLCYTFYDVFPQICSSSSADPNVTHVFSQYLKETAYHGSPLKKFKGPFCGPSGNTVIDYKIEYAYQWHLAKLVACLLYVC